MQNDRNVFMSGKIERECREIERVCVCVSEERHKRTSTGWGEGWGWGTGWVIWHFVRFFIF